MKMKVQDFKIGDYVKLICDYEKNPIYGVVENFYEDGTMVINDHQNGYSYHADGYTSQTVSLSTKTNFYFAKTCAFISFVNEEIKNAYHLFWDEN